MFFWPAPVWSVMWWYGLGHIDNRQIIHNFGGWIIGFCLVGSIFKMESGYLCLLVNLMLEIRRNLWSSERKPNFDINHHLCRKVKGRWMLLSILNLLCWCYAAINFKRSFSFLWNYLQELSLLVTDVLIGKRLRPMKPQKMVNGKLDQRPSVDPVHPMGGIAAGVFMIVPRL